MRKIPPKIVLLASVVAVVCGCASDTTAPREGNATQTFGFLRLDQHAITLAVAPPHNMIQLHVTPLSQAGTPLSESGTVQYRLLNNDTSVSVSASGVVTAKVPSYVPSALGIGDASGFYDPSTVLIASLTVQGITRTDTAVIVVTATEPTAPLATFSIHPPAESLSVYMSGHWLTVTDTKDLNLIQLDSHEDTIPNQLVYFRSSKPFVAYPYYADGVYGRGVHGLVANDTVTFFAQTWYYGVTRSDSLQVRVGYRRNEQLNTYERTAFGSVIPELFWWPQDIEVSAPAHVTFQNSSNTQAMDVQFDDPTDVQTDTLFISLYKRFYGYTFPVSAPGNIAPYLADTNGHGAACAASGTSRAADSLCKWGYRNFLRFRFFPKPGTYTYHTLFGNGGKIVVH